MGCFWSRGVTRGEEDGGEKGNIGSLDSVEGSECVGAVVYADVDRETQEPGVAEMFVGASSSTVSWYHSTRIQGMMEKTGEFGSDVESEIESSKLHWSEMDLAVSKTEHSSKANHEYMEVLRRRRYVREGGQLVAKQLETIRRRIYVREGGKFVAKQLEKIREHTGRGSLFNQSHWDSLVVGEKIAEGGQAEIYAARDGYGRDWAVKVFKAGSVLEHLEKQWPPGLLKCHQLDGDEANFKRITWGATLLRDERFLDRFAFVMNRYWGDLRKLIDERMMKYSHNQGPPFPPLVEMHLIRQIAYGMKGLHEVDPPILHNDLKAANVLVEGKLQVGPLLNKSESYSICVADYECSVGVMGTGFWRAPEILQQLKDKVPAAKVVVTKKCDIYSFGMVCYEIVSGRIPYEDYDFEKGCDHILKGGRPELPPDLDPEVKDVIRQCWHPNPLERPSFEDVWMACE